VPIDRPMGRSSMRLGSMTTSGHRNQSRPVTQWRRGAETRRNGAGIGTLRHRRAEGYADYDALLMVDPPRGASPP